MPLRIVISTGSSLPIYRQIADQIRLAVATGQLELGAQLPSVRNLAEELVINPNTVARAYGDLVREGALESRHGRGAFVARRETGLTKSERQRRLQPALQACVNEGLALGFDPQEIMEAMEKELNRMKRGGKNDGK